MTCICNVLQIHALFGPEKRPIHGTRTLLRVFLARPLLSLTSSVFRFNELFLAHTHLRVNL